MDYFKKFLSFTLSLYVCAVCTACTERSSSDTPDDKPDKVIVQDLDKYDMEKYLEPIFEGKHVYNETAMLLKNTEDKLDAISLYYPIKEIVSVRSFGLDVLYVAGKDYVLNDGKIEIPDGSALYSVACPYGVYYQSNHIPNANWPEVNGTGAQIMTEAQNGDKGLTKYQVAVTYTHDGVFGVEGPKDKSEKLPKTYFKLISGNQINMVCLGDSISAGWTASGYSMVNMKPFMPQYFNLVSNYLKEKVNGNIKTANLSVGGKTSDWGAAAKQINDVVSKNPDLVIIAFGMNEGVDKNYINSTYKRNIKSIMDKVRAVCPETEFILVATMLPNAEIGFIKGVSVLQQQGNYLASLNELESEYEGVAVADVTTISKEILSKKAFRDVSANNINHPNDYMQRVYAQIVLRTLIGK